MDIFGSVLAGVASSSWTQINMPAMGNVNIPAMGQVNMPAMGSVSMPAMGSVSMPSMGSINMPGMPGYTGGFMPVGGGGNLPSGIFEMNQGFGNGVGQVVGGVTGTANEIIVGPNPFDTNVSSWNLEMPSGGGFNNPFQGMGCPNPFYAAQLFGGCNSFYSGFGSAMSRCMSFG